MILSSESRSIDYSSDPFAIPYEDMHPMLQRYFDRLRECSDQGFRQPEHTLARLIAHARAGGEDFVRRFLTVMPGSTAIGPNKMQEAFLELNIDEEQLAESIIEYCNIKICENDIEFYTMGV